MKENHIRVSKTAHYYTLGSPSPAVKHWWILLHGYGQKAERLLEKFKRLEDDSHFFLAAEGMSRFYWGGVSGPVAASWMTKADRLDEIEDFSGMLTQIHNRYKRRLADDVHIHILGFSQGCATAIRWLDRTQLQVSSLTLWGGLFPEDIDYQPFIAYWQSLPTYWIYGDQDEYLTEERCAAHDLWLIEHNLKVEKHIYAGRHKVLPKVAAKLVQHIENQHTQNHENQ